MGRLMNCFRYGKLFFNLPSTFSVFFLAFLIMVACPLDAAYQKSTQLGKFQGPTRVVVSSDGYVFVTDYRMGKLLVLDAAGNTVGSIKTPGKSLGLAIDENPLAKTAVPQSTPLNCDDKQKNARTEKDKQKELIDKVKHRMNSQRSNKKQSQPESGNTDTTGGADAAEYECLANSQSSTPLELPIIYVGNEADGSVHRYENGIHDILGIGSGEFVKPNGIAVAADQNVYIVDSGTHQVKIYNKEGVLQAAIGSEGAAQGQLNYPIDIVLNDTAGEFYISDFWNSRVVVFDLVGNWKRDILAPLNDSGDAAFFRPSGLGIDQSGNLYVVDNALSCVVIMDSTGKLIDIIGYSNGQYWDGEIALPLDVAVSGSRVYVISSQDNTVQVFEVSQ